MPFRYVFNGRSVVRRQIDMKKASPKVVHEAAKEGSEQAGKGVKCGGAAFMPTDPKADKAKIRAALFAKL